MSPAVSTPRAPPPRDGRHVLAISHGWFFVISGLWPIVHLSSFMLVTGPKTDTWLVQTVGGLLAVIGLGLALAGHRSRVTAELTWIAGGSAFVLALIDVIFVSRDVIRPIYLADAAVEFALALAWAISAGRRTTSASTVTARSSV